MLRRISAVLVAGLFFLPNLQAQAQPKPSHGPKVKAMLARYGRDPEEVRACRERAKELAAGASPGERLLIQWIANVQEGNYVAGIAAMNDMLAMFPRDPHL